MKYLTDVRATEIADAAGIDAGDPDAVAQALNDAERLWQYVRRNEGISDQDLRAYADRNEFPPDRVNAALSILDAAHRIYHLDDSVPVPVEASVA